MLLTTAWLVNSVFALHATPRRKGPGPEYDQFRKDLQTDAKVLGVTMGIGYFGYLASHLIEQSRAFPSNNYRTLRAPNERKVRVTLEEGRDFDNCLSLMSNPRADPEWVFDQCLRYARGQLKIEDVLKDYQPRSHERPKTTKESTRGNNNNGRNNNHFSGEAVIDKGRQLVDAAGENIKEMLPKMMAPLIQAQKAGGGVAPIGGLKGVPGMRLVAPL
ncbi:MAG: hypothetical protein M1816_000656 [Peltula sp. TS41687]|nr:MAG: hypothetical protein M1816_000656 [Peltula sp. TS41687]